MTTSRILIRTLVFAATFAVCSISIQAQQPQIPTLQICNMTRVRGEGQVRIIRRSDLTHKGTFKLKLEVVCAQPEKPYPLGTMEITDISMSDSLAGGRIVATSIDQITTVGKHTPTVFMNGRCSGSHIIGCRFWLMIADNSPGTSGGGTSDIVSFLVLNSDGLRVAYGTGPVVSGAFTVDGL